MKMPLSFARRKTLGQDESTLKALAAARSPADAEAAIHSFPPIRAVVAATHLATLLWPSNLRTIEQAAAADELANKAKAQDMLGYKLSSAGHAIKRDWLDSGRATEAGRVSAKTVAWLVGADVFYQAACKPFAYGIAHGGWEGLAIAAAATLIGYATARGLKNALASVDRACDAAKKEAQEGSGWDLIAFAKSKLPLFDGRMMKIFGLIQTHGSGALRLLGRALGVKDLKKAFASLASKHLSDSRAFALGQALVALASRHGGFGAWGANRSSVSHVAQRAGLATLAVSGVPNEYRHPLAYDGLLPTGDTLAELQPAMLTEHHFGQAARTGLAYGLQATLATLLVWHPAMLDWAQLFEHPVQGLLEGLLTFDPATSLAMGGLAFAGAFRAKLAASYAKARIEHATDSVEQLMDFQAHERERKENDQSLLLQLQAAVRDRGARFALGKHVGVMNRKGMHNQPVRGTTFTVSEDVAKTGIALQGGTGSGKSFTVIEPFLAQLLAYRSRLLVDRKWRALARQMKLSKGTANRYRTAAMETQACSLFVMDYKMAMSTLLQRQAGLVGQEGDIRLIGAKNNEYAVDLLEDLSAQQAMDLLSDVLATRGGSSGDGPWLGLAKNVARASASVARVFQFTDEGLLWTAENGIKPFSIRFIYDLAMDSEGRMLAMCFDAIDKALRNNDDKVTPNVDDTFHADVATLLSDQWLSAPAPETKMGILINIQTLLGPLVSDPLLGQTFGSGNGSGRDRKRIMSLCDVWGNPEIGALVASNLSADLYGEPAAIINTFLKLRLYLEAQNRQTRFRNIASAAELTLRAIHAQLFFEELADESNPTTAEYLRLQRAAEPVLREVVRRLQEEAKWPIQLAKGPDGRVDESTVFGPGPFQSQFRRATRIIEKLGVALTEDESLKLGAAEQYRRDRSMSSGASDGIGLGYFSGASVSLRDILERSQRSLETTIDGVREEELMLENYIAYEGAPACPSEGLAAVRSALDRHCAYLVVDEYASLSTVSPKESSAVDDIQAAQTVRSTNLRLFFAYQTPSIVAKSLGGMEKYEALIASLRTQFILPDNEQKTADRIRSIAGTVMVRDIPKHGIHDGDRIRIDLPYAETIAADGDAAMAAFAESSYNKNPAMPYGGSRLDAFCEARLSLGGALDLEESLAAIPDDLAFSAAAVAGRVEMHKGFSFDVKPHQYALDETPEFVENSGSDNRNEIHAFKARSADEARNNNKERLATPLRKEEPISHVELSTQNHAFVSVLDPVGNRTRMDLVVLSVRGERVLQEARSRYIKDTAAIDAAEREFVAAQKERARAQALVAEEAPA